MEGITLLHGDCLELLPSIPDHSVDAVICDPPYGTLSCKWDTVIPFDLMWRELRRIIAPRGAIILFASQPFTSALIMSNPNALRHSWVWNKKLSGSFHLAKYQPLRITEDVLVFGYGAVNYYPQMRKGVMRKKGGHKGHPSMSEMKPFATYSSDDYYPTNILEYGNTNRLNRLHPTQKPVELLKFLVKSYTKEDQTVLDFTMGSGSCAVACISTGRKFIGIEKDDHYFEIASERIANTQAPLLTV